MKSTYKWNDDTLCHFKLISSYLSKKEVIEEMKEFIDVWCTVKDSDTEEMMIKDLTLAVFGKLKTTIKQRRENYIKQ
jgi:ADP-ribosylglycohydrolase